MIYALSQVLVCTQHAHQIHCKPTVSALLMWLMVIIVIFIPVFMIVIDHDQRTRGER